MLTSLRIATWNLEKPSPNGWSKNPSILEKIHEINADIWILTETNDAINPGEYYSQAASYSKPEWNGFKRTTIWSRLPIMRNWQTYDPWTGVCAEIFTPIENLLVYGTIITYAHDGVLNQEAKIWERHYESIQSHSRDWRKLNKLLPLCVAGDFNEALSQPFSYGTPKGREMLNKGLEQSNLVCVTANNELGYNIDHICLSLKWAKRVKNVNKWQAYKTNGNPVTDHFGVFVDLFLNNPPLEDRG
ncbi:hypothetical protein F7734_43415 [Scytonema sp. UIC 10036]|uniref:endonuclease/exonuclease/phosphatase family protein n=1 Tax=Scytonema sp. UIC 10036 TaxID=2304196 RepID=UPI0012DABFBF|nr:endonuclease/exonuclease/phosphatase family protein [Scytonema sp. UIC 10036]MUG98780.1 hypothetical protein [Scytonema sp. UIC 10036]